jgi:hypothetical protein
MSVFETRLNEEEKLVTTLAGKFDNFNKVVREIDHTVGSFKRELGRLNEGLLELDESQKGVTQFKVQLKYVEDELRQMRMLSEQNIRDTQAQLTTAISQRDCEDTILRFNYEFMSNFTKDLTMDDKKRNINLAG